MFKELKFVMGAVAKKDFIPVLKHFAIEDGTVRSYNGILALCSPIDFDINCKPKAIPLIKAIQNCEETLQLSMTAAGRLCVRSGAFKAHIECDQSEVTPHVMPEGDMIEINGQVLLDTLRIIEPFIADDANRQWANGVLFANQSLYVTNNVSLLQYWVGWNFPRTINVPRQAVTEIIRIGEACTAMQLSSNSVTFHYPDGRWIRSSLFSTEWPTPPDDVLALQSGNWTPLDQQLFEALAMIKPFTDKQGRVYFKDNQVFTHEDMIDGAVFNLDNHIGEGIYALETIEILKGVVTHIDWSRYPEACPFVGKNLRGVLIGRKQ